MLQPAAFVYGQLAELDRRRANPQQLPVPVIVVGNLVVGGAGKTPTTVALAQALQRRGMSPGVVSRGYGRATEGLHHVTTASTPSQVGDEPLLIHRQTKMPVVVGQDRAAAGRMLLAQSPFVNVLVADDGLQHHRLARDAQVIVIDERGCGNGLLLPAGPLREKLGLKVPPRSVVLYNAPRQVTPLQGYLALRVLRGAVPLAQWHRGAPASVPALHTLAAQPLTAAAGIASPKRFFDMLQALGLTFDRVALPDHFDWKDWRALPRSGAVIVTEKDAVKLPPDHPQAARIWVAPLDFSLPDSMIEALLPWINQHPTRPALTP